MENYKFPNKI